MSDDMSHIDWNCRLMATNDFAAVERKGMINGSAGKWNGWMDRWVGGCQALRGVGKVDEEQFKSLTRQTKQPDVEELRRMLC